MIFLIKYFYQVTPARSNGGYQSDDDRFDAPSEVSMHNFECRL
jgi:hypothetical protein